MLHRALEDQISRAAVAAVRTLPVPTRGWNTRDKLAETVDSLSYAPVLTNWIVNNSRLEMRRGYEEHSTGLPAENVESLMEYVSGSLTKLFAAVGSEIYDVTAAGAVGAAELSGLGNSRFQHTMFSTTSGQYLVAVNGYAGVRTFSGSAWASQVINNVAAADLIAVAAHKNRLWFIEQNTTSLWYLDTYAIAGNAVELDLGSLCSKGGHLMALATWTYDGGAGPDDLLAIVTSEGQVIVYAGTDPSSASTWELVGVYDVDRPLGRRCLRKYGADLVLLTESGVIQLSATLASIAGKDSFSDVIRDEFVNAAGNGRSNFGWEVIVYPKRGWLIANIPQIVAGQTNQFVYNTLNGAWSKFQDIPALCWAVSGTSIYFGGPDGYLAQADIGAADDGSNINADFQPAWSRYGTSQKKRFTMMRVNFFTDGQPVPKIAIRTEYDDSVPTASSSPVAGLAGGVWNVSLWNEANWGAGLAAWSRWQTVTGAGIVAAPRIAIATNLAQVAIVSIDVAFEIGGVL